MRVFLKIIAMAILSVPNAGAQTRDDTLNAAFGVVTPGDRVRIRQAGSADILRGVFRSVSNGAVVLESGESERRVSFPAIHEAWVSYGNGGTAATAGALLGGVAGGVFALGWTDNTAPAGLAGFVLGAVPGYIIGKRIGGSSGWRHIYPGAFLGK